MRPKEEWCQQEIDCSDPPKGVTCIPDICALNSSNIECKAIYAKPGLKQSQYSIIQYIMLGCIVLVLLLVIAKQCGWIGGVKIPETVEEEQEIEEKKIFNTAENFTEAQVAIEHLLWQIYEHEQNLDMNKKYEKDIHKTDYYDD